MMTTPEGFGMTRAIVVGGGIGGLAAAISLSAKGYRVVVIERGEFAELGAGIQLAPNGMHALDRLGIGEEVRKLAVHIDALHFKDGLTGTHVATMALGSTYRERFGHPYVVVHRGELHRLLLDACRSSERIQLISNSMVVGYEQDHETGSALLDTGERVAGEVIVGADGINSTIRRQLLGDGDPRIAGITVYRSIVPMTRVPPELRSNSVTWWAGPGWHFVHYPIAGGKYLNLAPSRETGVTEAFSNRPLSAAGVREELTSLCDEALRLLELGNDWKSWALVDRDPVLTWTDGRIALLGDAAHPSLHYVAQGACQALEDAVVLGDMLDCPTGDIAQQLIAYATRRRERTARIQLTARASIDLWHPVGDAAHRRNAALAAMSQAQLHDQVAWMHEAQNLQTSTGRQ